MFEKKFVMSLLCLVVVLSLLAGATRGANILFVSSMTAEADDALKAFMEGLGHTVTYIDDDDDEATTEAAAAAADLVYISESVGSGGIKNEITEVEVPMIVGEPWAWDEMGLTEGSGGDDPAVTTDAEIVDAGHYLAGGLSGTVAVLTEVLEGCNLGKGVTGPEATVIATAALSDGVTYDVIFVYEKGAALAVAPADGSAQVAADMRIGFGFHANCYSALSEDAYVLLGAAVDYALGLTGPSGPVNPGTDGLVASYALDGDANDSSGNEHNGTAVGGPAFVEGQIGMALDFDGTDDVVELGKFDVVGGITLAAWIKADDFEINDARIITKANEWSGDSHWWMVSTISETSLRFRLKTDEGPATATLISDPVLEAGVFAHVAATWDGSMMRLYKDGVEVASQEKGGTAVAVDPDISAAIGSQPSDAFASDPSHVAKFFDGLIDDVRIYDRALSEGELLYLAGARATPVDPGTDGLAAFYALENDVLDGSGNSNDGTIVGAPTFVDGLAGYGMAMEFDGESYVDVGNDASLDIPGPISIALWIRPGADDPEGQGTEAAPMAKADAGSSPSWSWQVRYGWNSPQPYMAFTFNTSPRAWAYVGKNLEKDEWAHIACSHDGATLKCYLDGEETDSIPMGAITSSPAPVLIGSDGWRSDWIGALDEVAIYGRALSDGEVRYLAGIRENLALNPSFEEDEPVLDDPDWYSWGTWNPAEGAGSNATIVDTDAADGARSLRIEPVGVENWHFIVLNLPITVDMDKNYTTSFWAKAEEPRPLTVQIKAEDNSISAWGATAFDLTTEWAEYSYTSEVLIDVIKVEFLCAGVEVPFLLDLVSVSEAK
jgi:hypothetical protein